VQVQNGLHESSWLRIVRGKALCKFRMVYMKLLVENSER
jgi:hypothetical protein